MPDRTTVTSGWLYSHRNAQAAGVHPRWFSAISFFASGGSACTSFPPRSGSMMMTGIPFAAAACSPSAPACVCSSR